MTPPELLACFQKYLQDKSLHIFIDKNWSSQNENYRTNLRYEILKKLRDLGDIETPELQILNLEHPPLSSLYKISVSHCRAEGGFALSKNFRSIGFDIEQIARIKNSAVERLALGAQSTIPALPAALWVAQEAAFKAFAPTRSVTHASQIQVTNWGLAEENTYSFSAKYINNSDSITAKGLVVSSQELIYSFIGLN